MLKKPVRNDAEEAAAAANAKRMVIVQTSMGKQRCRAGLLDKAFDSYFSEAEMRQRFLGAQEGAPEVRSADNERDYFLNYAEQKMRSLFHALPDKSLF